MNEAELYWLMTASDAPDERLTLEDFLARPAWHRRAACRGVGPSDYVRGPKGDYEAVRALCEGCPVRRECSRRLTRCALRWHHGCPAARDPAAGGEPILRLIREIGVPSITPSLGPAVPDNGLFGELAKSLQHWPGYFEIACLVPVRELLTEVLGNVFHRSRLEQESLHLDLGHHPFCYTLSGRHRSSSSHPASHRRRVLPTRSTYQVRPVPANWKTSEGSPSSEREEGPEGPFAR